MSVIDDALRSMRQRLAEIEREGGELRTAIMAIEQHQRRPTINARGRQVRATAPARLTPAQRAPRGQNRRTILDAIKNEAKTAKEIETQTGIPAAVAGSTLHKLVREGRAKKATRGYLAVR